MSKLRVLFVAGLTPASDGLAGGQGTVAQAIFHSALRTEVDFEPLSTTMRSLPPPPLPMRAFAALSRTLRFIRRIRKNDVALVFSSDGFSLVEKSVMCMVARALGRGVVLRTSAGGLRPQVERSVVLRWFFLRAMGAAHVVCSQGQAWTEFFAQFRAALGKVVEVPNAVDLPPFSEAQRKLQLLYVGWMVRAKGIYDLVPILAQVRRRFPDTILHVVGSGGEAARFALAVEAAQLTDAVRIHGWLPRERVFTLMHDSAALVLPSHSEGLANVVLESMAAGTPVVTTRVGSLPDVIREGENGFLADPGDVASMSAALERILAGPDLARRVADQARQAAEGYSIGKVWPRYLEVLRRAASEAGRQVDHSASKTMSAQSAKG